MATNSNKRKQPSASSSNLFISDHNIGRPDTDEERAGNPSGFHVFIRGVRTRRVFSPTPNQIRSPGHEGLPAETRKVGREHCPPIVSDSKGNEELGKPDSVEDCVQATPPEAVEVFDQSGREWWRNANRVSIQLSNIGSSITNQKASNLSLRVRGRLFKTPSSFSYRRLLPYLMGNAKEDDSGIIRTCQSQKHEKDTEEKHLQRASDSSCRDIPMDESSQDNSRTLLGHSPAMEPTTTSGLMEDPSLDDVTCPAPANEILGENGTSTEDGDVIGNALIHDQSPVKHDPRKCIDSDIRECPDDDKAMEEAEKAVPTDFDQEEGSEESLRKQTCSQSCKHKIDSPSRSYSIDTAECNAVPPSEKATGPMKNSPNGTIRNIKTSSPQDGDKSPSNRKKMSNPRSRSKLFKCPSSFSYRRLLPYLMEIEKDDHCTMVNTYPQKPCDSSNEELPSAPQSLQSLQTPSVVPNEQSPTAPDSALPCASLRKDQNDEPNTEGSEVKSVSSPETKKMINEVDTDMSDGDKLVHEDPPQDGADGASAPVKIPFMNSQRGILKKNPRGCRGLCPCLTCASFRLNAEQAFEFSRNQMKDAEELALDLLKEMSYLRKLLERVNSSAVAPDSVVLQACRNALEAEDIAKAQLRQMNEDLSIHCRVKDLHRPSVMFDKLCPKEHSK